MRAHSAVRGMSGAGSALAVCLLLFPAIAAHAKDKPRPPAAIDSHDYIGSAECRGCHETIGRQFNTNPHWSSNRLKVAGAAERACESCHGPGRAHADSLGQPGTIVHFTKVSATAVAANCLTCHQYSDEPASFRR